MIAANQRRRGERGSRLTKQAIERIVAAVRSRNYLEASAEMAGIPRDVLYGYLRDGRRLADDLEAGLATRTMLTAHQKRLVELARAVTQANAEAETGSIALIGRAGTTPSQRTIEKTKVVGTTDQGNPIYATETTTILEPPDWRALAWVAERRWNERWSKTTIAQHTGPGGGPIPVEHRIEGILSRVSELRAGPVDDVIDIPDGLE